MPNSRANRPHLLALAAVLALGGAEALAQSPAGQPMTLGPPAQSQALPPSPEAEREAKVLKVVPSPILDAAPAKPALPEHRFQVEELRAPDPEGLGVLDERQGGLGAHLWQGTPAALVRQLLPRIPAQPPSRTLHGLARRLLLSVGAPPEGARGQSPSLAELRAERLFAMGETEGLANLLKVVPGQLSSPGLARIRMESALLAGDAKAACAEAGNLGAGLDSRLQVFCMLSSGKVLEANMALDLMRERKDADHAFIAAAEAMAGTPPPKVDRLPQATALHLAAFKAAKMPLPADAAASASPAMLRALADNASLPVDLRVPAAEKAEALGVLDTDSLRKLYASVSFTPAEQQAAMGQGDRNPRARILLMKAAQQEQTPAVKAELLARILTTAAERGAFSATARLYAPILADVKPAPDLVGFAPILARALFAAGRPEAAGNWINAAKADPAQARAAEVLWPLVRLNRQGETPAATAEAYAAWLDANAGLPADQAERRGQVGLSLLQAVGEKVPGTQWLALPKGPQAALAGLHSPPLALKSMLRAAAEDKRIGETVLLVLINVGESGLDKMDADSLNRVVAALRQVGLEREARDLAMEAALATGL